MGVIMTWIISWELIYLYIISRAYEIDPFCSVTFVMTTSLVLSFIISIGIGWVKLR